MFTEFTLPGGWFDARGTRRVCGSLRALNGSDEEWARGLPTSTSRATFVTGLLARCVKRFENTRATRTQVRGLTVGDRDYLLLKLYQASFGDAFSLLLTCPREACGARMDLTLSMDDIPVEQRPCRPSYLLTLEHPQPIEIEFRLPCGADQEAVGECDAAAGSERLLEACVIRTSSGVLPAWARGALMGAIEEHSPRPETEMEARCPECGAVFDAELDWTALLLDELRRSRTTFDREIHLLAYHYHWPLRELLSLTRARRSRYLALIAGQLDAHAG